MNTETETPLIRANFEFVVAPDVRQRRSAAAKKAWAEQKEAKERLKSNPEIASRLNKQGTEVSPNKLAWVVRRLEKADKNIEPGFVGTDWVQRLAIAEIGLLETMEYKEQTPAELVQKITRAEIYEKADPHVESESLDYLRKQIPTIMGDETKEPVMKKKVEKQRRLPRIIGIMAVGIVFLGTVGVLVNNNVQAKTEQAEMGERTHEVWPGETRQEEIQRLPLSFGDAGEFEDEMRSDPVISEHFRKAQELNMSGFWEERKPDHLQETSMEWIKTVAPDKEFSIPVGGVVPDKIKYKSSKAGMSFLTEDNLEFAYGNHRELFKTLKPGDLIAGENCIYYVEAVNNEDPINQQLLLSGIGGGGGQERVKFFSVDINTIEGLIGPWFTIVKKTK